MEFFLSVFASFVSLLLKSVQNMHVFSDAPTAGAQSHGGEVPAENDESQSGEH